jgi:hypothetical protein
LVSLHRHESLVSPFTTLVVLPSGLAAVGFLSGFTVPLDSAQSQSSFHVFLTVSVKESNIPLVSF